ncbi:MAG: O-antigen ligase [Candidatus Lokiarchaeota archaeon]
MNNELLELYSIAKYTSQEILLEENIQNAGASTSIYLENFKKNKRSLRIQIVVMKIFYAFLFSILPIIPLLTFFQITQNIGIVDFEILIFIGCFIFSVFFLLQLFNLILMGMINVTTIMSGKIFHWFETLPISKQKMQKLGFITMFRSLDIPILAFAGVFPVVILIGTLNIILFLVCLGISIINTIFSFCVLILVGKKLTKAININKGNSKKGLLIRAINLLGFIITTLVSVYLVQWAFSQIGSLVNILATIRNANILNLLLSLMPYPLNPSILISISIDPVNIPPWILLNGIIGFALFIIITYYLYDRAVNSINQVISSKFENQNVSIQEEKEIEIKTTNPVISFLKKDLTIATRDIQTLMVFVMPIFVSFVFVLAYLFGKSGGHLIFEAEIYYYWVIQILFQPFVACLLVYGLLNTEQSGETIISSLPIVPRDQAKAKLILILIIQTIAVLAPSLIYINDYKFPYIVMVSFLALPFVFIFLLLIFLLRIYFFGKVGDYYVIEEVFPENKFQKWAIIFIFAYALSFWMISDLSLFIRYRLIELMLFTLIVTCIISYLVILSFFNKMFPTKEQLNKNVGNQKRMKNSLSEKVDFVPKKDLDKKVDISYRFKHPWISIGVFLLAFWLYTYLFNGYILNSLILYLQGLIGNDRSLVVLSPIISVFLPLICESFFFLVIIRKLIFSKIRSKKEFHTFIGLGWITSKNTFKKLILPVVLAIVLYFTFSVSSSLNFYLYVQTILNSMFFSMFSLFINYLWITLAFQGVVLSILNSRFSMVKSILLTSVLLIILNLISGFVTIYSISSLYSIITFLFLYFLIGILVSYSYLKGRNIIISTLIWFITITLFIYIPVYL